MEFANALILDLLLAHPSIGIRTDDPASSD